MKVHSEERKTTAQRKDPALRIQEFRFKTPEWQGERKLHFAKSLRVLAISIIGLHPGLVT